MTIFPPSNLASEMLKVAARTMSMAKSTSSGTTGIDALFRAIDNNEPDKVAALLANGMSPDAMDTSKQTALYQAASRGHIACLNALLDAGARVNARRRTGGRPRHSTALNRAIYDGNFEAAEVLLARGADPRITGDDQSTPGHILLGDSILKHRHEVALRVLTQMLDRGMAINQKDGAGQTMLDQAVAKGASAKIISALLERGALTASNAGKAAARHSDWSGKNLDVLRLLAAHGFDINCRDAGGRSILYHAEDVAAFDEMIGLGADIHQIDNNGQNVLGWLVDDKPVAGFQIIVRLIEEGCDADHPDYSGESAASVLADRTDDIAVQIKAVIAARRARLLMSSARERRPAPSIQVAR